MSEDNIDDTDYGTGSATSAEIVEALKSGFKDLLDDVLADAKGDVKAYAAQLAQEFGRYLWRSVKDKDATAKRNLTHLKAQVALIAVKREIVATRETMAKLSEIAEIAARIGIKALLAAAL